MPQAPFRDPLLAALAPRLAALGPRTDAVLQGLSPGRFAQGPPDGGWSVAQVLEHLCRGNEAYLGPMERAVASARSRGRGSRPHRHSLIGGLLLGAVAESSPRRLPTTRKMTPQVVRDGVADAFRETLVRIATLAREADGADLRERLWSPIAPVPLNLGDAFEILVAHAERHLGQAERARRAIGA